MKTQLNLDDALRISLPKLISDNKSLNDIIEIIVETIYSNNCDFNSKIIESLTGLGSFDEFPINIHEFLGVYWNSAPEFNNDGYFTNLNDAISFAKNRYDPYIS